jgi:hypothetical protein
MTESKSTSQKNILLYISVSALRHFVTFIVIDAILYFYYLYNNDILDHWSDNLFGAYNSTQIILMVFMIFVFFLDMARVAERVFFKNIDLRDQE